MKAYGDPSRLKKLLNLDYLKDMFLESGRLVAIAAMATAMLIVAGCVSDALPQLEDAGINLPFGIGGDSSSDGDPSPADLNSCFAMIQSWSGTTLDLVDKHSTIMELDIDLRKKNKELETERDDWKADATNWKGTALAHEHTIESLIAERDNLKRRLDNIMAQLTEPAQADSATQADDKGSSVQLQSTEP